MWFDIQSKSLNSAGEGTASRPEPDGTDFFFSSITHTRLGHSFIFFFFVCFSRVQAEFLSYCFPDIHSYKIILIVLRKFVVNCRIFFSSSIKSDLFNSVFSVAILKRSTWARKFGIRVMTSGIAFDRPDRLSRLRAFPYDRFKIYTIVPIIRIELNSIQAIEVVSVVRVVCDRLGSVSIWSFRSSEHFLRRLGRSGRSGRSYGNQA